MANAQNWKREREQRPPRKIYRSYRKPGKSLRTLVSALVNITMSSMSGIWPKVKACDYFE